jgi:hypothetical protein
MNRRWLLILPFYLSGCRTDKAALPSDLQYCFTCRAQKSFNVPLFSGVSESQTQNRSQQAEPSSRNEE